MLHKWQIHSSVSRDGGLGRAFSVGRRRFGSRSPILEGGHSAHVDPGVTVGSGWGVRPRPGVVHSGGLGLLLSEGRPVRQRLPGRRLPGRLQRRPGPLQRDGAGRHSSSVRRRALILPVCLRAAKNSFDAIGCGRSRSFHGRARRQAIWSPGAGRQAWSKKTPIY